MRLVLLLSLIVLSVCSVLIIFQRSLEEDDPTELMIKVPTQAQVNKELASCKMPICASLAAELKVNDKMWGVHKYKWSNKGQAAVMKELQSFDDRWATGSWWNGNV